MKKFVFSLESLLKLKKTRKKKLKTDMEIAKQRLEREQKVLSIMKHEKAYIQYKIEELSRKGIKAFDLREYSFYFKLLCESIAVQADKCRQIEKECEQIRAALIDIHKQIDLLEELKQERYMEYMYELQKSEEKALEELVNFNFITRSEHTYG